MFSGAGTFAALGAAAMWTYEWIAGATLPVSYGQWEPDGPFERHEIPATPPFGSLDWFLLTVPRVAITGLVLAALGWAIAARIGRRGAWRASMKCGVAAVAALLIVLARVASLDVLELRPGVYAAEFAIAAALVTAVAVRPSPRSSG